MADRTPITFVQIDGFVIDASLSEDHSFNADVTSHPVEKGGDITDHVRPLPVEVTITGLVSDTPIGAVADLRDESSLPTQSGLDKFLELRDERKVVTISTALRVYQNMVLESLSVPRSSRIGQALEFTAKFRQIEVVTNERTTATIQVTRAKRGKNLGSRPANQTGVANSDAQTVNAQQTSRIQAYGKNGRQRAINRTGAQRSLAQGIQ